jgi:hypothetical protein
MFITRLVNYLAALLLPRVARELALDLEAHCLAQQVGRQARLREKAEELRAAGHEDLAGQLLQQAATLSTGNTGVFETRLPGLPELIREPGDSAPVTLAPPPASPPPVLPTAPSPNGKGRRPRGSPAQPPSPPAAPPSQS